jgi:hypothetical protein
MHRGVELYRFVEHATYVSDNTVTAFACQGILRTLSTDIRSVPLVTT